MASPLDVALSAGTKIGRYFSVVSVVPALLIVVYLYFLATAAFGGEGVDLGRGAAAVADVSFAGAAWLALLAMVVGLILHPLQFALTQLMEGYWGAGRIGVALASWRIVAHRQRARSLKNNADRAEKSWTEGAYASLPQAEVEAQPEELDEQVRLALARLVMDTGQGDSLIREYVEAEMARKALDDYPALLRRVMPTRLGNVLRRNEEVIGSGYGLNLLAVAPYLSQVADPKDYRRLEGEGEQMDLALRLCLTFSVATTATLVAFAHAGFLAFAALGPYVAAYGSYRGACVSANHYMSSAAMVLQLNRFALYERLHLERPTDAASEAATAANVLEMLANRRGGWKFRGDVDQEKSKADIGGGDTQPYL